MKILLIIFFSAMLVVGIVNLYFGIIGQNNPKIILALGGAIINLGFVFKLAQQLR